MEQGYIKIFWGLLISIFDINIGSINILPDFIGYFILGSGIYKLYEEFVCKEFKIANSLANFLMVYSLFMSVLNYGFNSNLIGTDLNSNPIKQIIDMGLAIFVSSIILIMAFNIISGTLSLYKERERITEANNLEKTQRNYTVFYIVGIILECISLNISNKYIGAAVALYLIIITLYFAIIISNIRKNISVM